VEAAAVAIGQAAGIVRATSKGGYGFRDRPARRRGSVKESSQMPGGASDFATTLTNVLPFVLIFVIMYFLILRPQQKRAKQHQEMVKNLRRGDNVITSGGLVGKVTKVVDDDQVEIEIADGVRVRQVKSMVADVRVKGEPVKDESAAG
jgi:preprotein translocase subunit YajC